MIMMGLRGRITECDEIGGHILRGRIECSKTNEIIIKSDGFVMRRSVGNESGNTRSLAAKYDKYETSGKPEPE